MVVRRLTLIKKSHRRRKITHTRKHTYLHTRTHTQPHKHIHTYAHPFVYCILVLIVSKILATYSSLWTIGFVCCCRHHYLKGRIPLHIGIHVYRSLYLLLSILLSYKIKIFQINIDTCAIC